MSSFTAGTTVPLGPPDTSFTSAQRIINYVSVVRSSPAMCLTACHVHCRTAGSALASGTVLNWRYHRENQACPSASTILNPLFVKPHHWVPHFIWNLLDSCFQDLTSSTSLDTIFVYPQGLLKHHVQQDNLDIIYCFYSNQFQYQDSPFLVPINTKKFLNISELYNKSLPWDKNSKSTQFRASELFYKA